MVGQIRSSKAVRAGAGCWEPTPPRRRRLVPRSTTTGQSRSRRCERTVRIRSRHPAPPAGSCASAPVGVLWPSDSRQNRKPRAFALRITGIEISVLW